MVLQETKRSVSAKHNAHPAKINYKMAIEAAQANIAAIDSTLYLFQAIVAKH